MQPTGEKIRLERQKKGYTQDYLAKKLRMSQTNYSKIESGEINLTIDRITEISELLGINPLDILPFDKGAVFNNCTQSDFFFNCQVNSPDLIEKLAANLQALADTLLKIKK